MRSKKKGAPEGKHAAGEEHQPDTATVYGQ